MIFQVRFANFDYSVSPEPPSVATVGALPTVGAYPARGLVLAIRRSDSPYYVVSPCFAITKRLLPYCDLRFVDSKGHSRFVLRISIISVSLEPPIGSHGWRSSSRGLLPLGA